MKRFPRFPRFPLATGALIAGAIGGMALSEHLHGQAPAVSPQNQPLPAVMPKEFASYRDVVKRIVPAVVSIEAKAKVVVRDRGPTIETVTASRSAPR